MPDEAAGVPPVPGARCVASAGEVHAAHDRLAAGLQPVIDRADTVLLAVLLGGAIPLVHLAGRLHGDFRLDYCHVTRYRGSTRGGQLEWVQPPHLDLSGTTVVIVDDIFDRGVTLDYVAEHCTVSGAARVLSAVLVHKQHERAMTGLRPDFVGLTVDDHYVFGAGMDYRHRWRHLADIWALDSAVPAP